MKNPEKKDEKMLIIMMMQLIKKIKPNMLGHRSSIRQRACLMFTQEFLLPTFEGISKVGNRTRKRKKNGK